MTCSCVGAPALVGAAGVVRACRAIDADADVEAVLREEGAPLVVEPHAIGLEVVDAGPAVRQVSRLQLDRRAIEVDAEQRRLAAVPDEVHGGPGAGLDERADVDLEQLVGHAKALTGGEELRLGEVVAVAAVEVAHRARRLGHDDEWRGGGGHLGLRGNASAL